MSLQWTTIVWSRSPYTHSMRLIHLALADYADKNGRCFPGLPALAEKATVTERYLRDALARMVEDGWLRRESKNFVLLDPELSSETAELSSSQTELSSAKTELSSALYREPSRTVTEPSEEPSTPPPSGRGGRKDDSVRTYGQDPDDTQEMPEGRMGPDDYERPEKKPKPKFESVPKENTRSRAMYEWSRGVERLRGRSTQGVILAAIRDLHGEGYSYAEITMLIETFFLRYEHEVRSKRTEIDAGVMFRQRVPQLLEQTESKIKDKRAGRESSLEYNTRLGQERLAPMREWIESRKGQANA